MSLCIAFGIGAGMGLGMDGMTLMEAAANTHEQALDARSRELTELQQTLEAVGAELITQEASRLALVDELERREREVASAAVASRELAAAVAEQTRVAEGLRARQREEQTALQSELEIWADMIRTAHLIGRADRVRLFLNQEDMTRASRALAYHAYLNREQARRVSTIQSRISRLMHLATNAGHEATRLAHLAESQQQAYQRLEQARLERATILARLEDSIASQSLDLKSLERDAESLRRLVEHLRQRAQIAAELDITRESFQDRKGQIAWPLLTGEVVAAFGSQTENSELNLDGVLLAAREGEEVRAVHDGRVVHADWLRGFGLLLVIDHGEGYMSIYGHNQALLKEPGEWVATGEVIALSGNSGGHDEPVLYFAIRHQGTPQDPSGWCGRSGRQDRASASLRQSRYIARERPETEGIKQIRPPNT